MNMINDVIDWLLFGGALAAFITFWNVDLKPYLQNKINLDTINDYKELYLYMKKQPEELKQVFEELKHEQDQ